MPGTRGPVANLGAQQVGFSLGFDQAFGFQYIQDPMRRALDETALLNDLGKSQRSPCMRKNIQNLGALGHDGTLLRTHSNHSLPGPV